MNWAAVTWLALMVTFLVAEAATVSLVSLWFAAGALAAMVVTLLGGGIAVQLMVFFAVSIALLAALRPMVRKFVTPRLTRTNVDSILGSTGYVTEEINNASAQGQVKLGSMFWTARSSSGASVPKGTLVKADRIEGVKVFVSPVEAAVPAAKQ